MTTGQLVAALDLSRYEFTTRGENDLVRVACLRHAGPPTPPWTLGLHSSCAPASVSDLLAMLSRHEAEYHPAVTP